MTRWAVLAGAGLLAAGCAAPRAEALRAQYREKEAADRARTLSPEEVRAYRSTEAVRGARWGMTPEELLAARGEPREREGGRWVYAEDFDGVVVSSSYLFVQGQLVAIRTAWSREELTRERLEAALGAKYGAPVSRADLQAQLQERLTAAQRDDALMVLMGLWPLASRHALERDLVDARSRPLLHELWSSPQTLVDLVSVDGQRSVVTWRSRELLGLLQARERAAGGADPLKDKL